MSGDKCVAEHVQRYHLPVWLTNALEVARLRANPERLGAAIVHEYGERRVLIVFTLDDYQMWHGPVRKVTMADEIRRREGAKNKQERGD